MVVSGCAASRRVEGGSARAAAQHRPHEASGRRRPATCRQITGAVATAATGTFTPPVRAMCTYADLDAGIPAPDRDLGGWPKRTFPLCYHLLDEAKTPSTFPRQSTTKTRYTLSVPDARANYTADSCSLYTGLDSSVTINSGGEKIFRRGCRAAFRPPPAVVRTWWWRADPAIRWGTRWWHRSKPDPALTPRPDSFLCPCRRTHRPLQALPKYGSVFVDHVPAQPVGQADYRWPASRRRSGAPSTP